MEIYVWIYENRRVHFFVLSKVDNVKLQRNVNVLFSIAHFIQRSTLLVNVTFISQVMYIKMLHAPRLVKL